MLVGPLSTTGWWVGLRSTQITKLLSISAVILAVVVPVFAQDDDQTSVCVQAEKRYVEIFETPSSEARDVVVIKMYKNNFCPNQITVPVGTTVRWVNVDKRASHSVLAPAVGIAESDRAFPTERIEFTFLTPGPVNYMCGPHWETQGMMGVISVE